MSHDIKALRSQLRQIAKELLTTELVSEVENKLMKVMMERLDKIEQRQKDILGFTVRNSSMPTPAKK